MNAIEVEDLTKIYGTTIAVDCISLNVKRRNLWHVRS